MIEIVQDFIDALLEPAVHVHNVKARKRMRIDVTKLWNDGAWRELAHLPRNEVLEAARRICAESPLLRTYGEHGEAAAYLRGFGVRTEGLRNGDVQAYLLLHICDDMRDCEEVCGGRVGDYAALVADGVLSGGLVFEGGRAVYELR